MQYCSLGTGELEQTSECVLPVTAHIAHSIHSISGMSLKSGSVAQRRASIQREILIFRRQKVSPGLR